jgi:hypothetical protein
MKINSSVICLPEPEAAPLACGGRILVPFIELNVLNRVAESELIDARASGNIGTNFYDRQGVN